MLKRSASPSRRFTSRVKTPPSGGWVDWRSAGREDILRVRNMSLGGLVLETPTPRNLGSGVSVEFLVEEGQIRADAVVMRVEPGDGLSLKFTRVIDQDRLRLT